MTYADDWFLSMIFQALKDSGKEISDPKQSSRIVKEIISKSLPEFSELLLKTLKLESLKMLKDHGSYRRQFERRLIKKWKKPIDLLETLLVISYELGDEFNRKHRMEASKTQDCVFDVLTRLHAKACQVGFEILVLLKSGLSDGAHARWRTLHEIAVISFFIKEHGQEVARRYLDYMAIDNFKEAYVFQRYCRQLGYEPLTEEEMNAIRKMRERVLEIYGREFGDRYGWIPKKILRTRNFAEMEKSVKLDKFRQYYQLACYNIHSGPKELRFKLGLIKNDTQSEVILAGPSDYGLADPGQCSAISIYQITTCLLSIRTTFGFLVEIQTMKRLVDETNSAFCKVQSQIKDESISKSE